MKHIAIIFAGGVGRRMETSAVPKQFLEIENKPILIHTLELFSNHPDVDEIVVVCVADWIERLQHLLVQHDVTKVSAVIPGGATTQESIYHGLCEAERLCMGDEAVVLIHDGVRPLITAQTISDNIVAAEQYGACVTCVRPTETIIHKGPLGLRVPKRKDIIVARAPQSFHLSLILGLHRQSIADGQMEFTDCCEMMYYYGKSYQLVFGPEENIKVTTKTDLYICEALMKMRKS